MASVPYCALLPLRPFIPSMALCPLYGPLSSLWHTVLSITRLLYSRLSPSKALCPLFSSLSSLLPYVSSSGLIPSTTLVSSKALCPLYALCLLYNSFPLYDYLSPQGPSVLSMALCPTLQPSVPSMALCFLYGPLSPLKNSETSETTLLFREMFCKTHFVKTPRVIAIYFV
jgi:hypothetical protein